MLHIRKLEAYSTYTTSLQVMVLSSAEPKRDQQLIRRNVEWLTKSAHRYRTQYGEAVSWRYTPNSGSYDNSNAQFAVLALREAERAGVILPDAFWNSVANHFRACQAGDGGWAYTTGTRATGSMTTAGISSLIIASGKVGQRRALIKGGLVRCCGNATDDDDWNRIQRGLDWLGRHFSVRLNPGTSNHVLYYLYGLERVGRLTGSRFIGAHDWYREGADYLVQMQRRGLAGQWRGKGTGETDPVVGTALALLFLSKGKRPVVIAKLEHGTKKEWDYHPAGIPNLVHHIENSWGRPLTWQSVDWQSSTVDHLLETPVLFLSSALEIPVRGEDKQKLKSYIQQGGFLFAEARDGNGCDGKRFDKDFRALMHELFPESPLRLLPPEHPVWYADGKVASKFIRPLLGVDACCRVSIVYCPKNLSCFWELSDRRELETTPDLVKSEIEACVQIGRNVVAYATNRTLRDKLDQVRRVKEGPELPPTDRGVLTVGKLMHEGGGNDAPNALPNLLAFCAGEIEFKVRVENRLVQPTDDRLYEYPLLYAQGRFDFKWTDEEVEALQRYVGNGGVIFADAICSSPEFTKAFQREASRLFTDRPWQRIPLQDRLFADNDGGFDLSRVTLNDPRGAGQGIAANRVKIQPLLQGIQAQERWAIIFSPYDLSCALQNSNSPDCKGYVSEDAYRIGLNVILHVLRQ